MTLLSAIGPRYIGSSYASGSTSGLTIPLPTGTTPAALVVFIIHVDYPTAGSAVTMTPDWGEVVQGSASSFCPTRSQVTIHWRKSERFWNSGTTPPASVTFTAPGPVLNAEGHCVAYDGLRWADEGGNRMTTLYSVVGSRTTPVTAFEGECFVLNTGIYCDSAITGPPPGSPYNVRSQIVSSFAGGKSWIADSVYVGPGTHVWPAEGGEDLIPTEVRPHATAIAGGCNGGVAEITSMDWLDHSTNEAQFEVWRGAYGFIAAENFAGLPVLLDTLAANSTHWNGASGPPIHGGGVGNYWIEAIDPGGNYNHRGYSVSLNIPRCAVPCEAYYT